MEEAKPIARRYVALQKRVQGIDKVHFYDLSAPLAESNFRLNYSDGQAFIETGLRPLGDAYQKFLHAAFEEGRIDLADNHGKFPIPVTLTSYGAPTYILSTWYDLLSDAMVLGHELGHLVHTDFTRAQNRFDGEYGMLVAETASTIEAIQAEGQPAIDRYLAFLQSAGARSTPETYANAGIDMMNPETLRKGIRHFGKVLTELEAQLSV